MIKIKQIVHYLLKKKIWAKNCPPLAQFSWHNLFQTILVAAFCSFFFIQSSAAFDLFGFHLWGPKKEDEQIEKKTAYKIFIYATNNDNNLVKKKHAPDDHLSAIEIVKNSSSLFADRENTSASSVRLLTKAREDYKRILHAFYAEGYYGATISIRINGQEAANIAPETILPEMSYINILVNPGPLYIFSRAIIHNYPLYPKDKKQNQRQKIEKLSFAKNNIAKAKYIFQAEEDAIQKWRELGHAKAKIVKEDIIADHKALTISAEIWIDPGPQSYYKHIILENISKNPRMDKDFILYITGLKVGQIYNPTQIEEARDRLAKLGVFQAQIITEEEMDKTGGLTIKIVVQERALRRFGLGATYSSLDGFGFNAYILYRNLFRKAENFRADFKIANFNGLEFNTFTPKTFFYSAAATYTSPGVFTPNTNFVTSLKYEQENLNLYQTLSVSLQSGFIYKINPVLSGYTYLETSLINSKDPTLKDAHFFTLGLSNEFLYDNRDSITNPATGRYNETTINPFYEGVYGSFISKITSEERHYFGFGADNKLIIALKGKAGTILGSSQFFIPSNYLFFAGGGSSVRGYSYRSLGVKDEKTGQILGGRSLAEGSLELRMLPFRSIGFTTFLDAGLVSSDLIPHKLKDTKLGLGVGAFYLTALGPIRFDLAWPINSDHKGLSFYIGIGQTF